MKYLNVLILLFFTSCTVDNTATDLRTEENIQAIFEKNVVSYPIGNSTNPEENVLKWGNFAKEKQQEARFKARQITIDGISIANKITRNLNGYQDDQLPQLIKSAEIIFDEYSESDALLFAKQVFAMKIQEYLFEGFITHQSYKKYMGLNLSKNQLELLRYSTILLINSGNSNADLLLLNLTLLKNHLNKTEIKTLARKAIKNAEIWYEEDYCSSCNLKNSIPEMTKKERVFSSISQLQNF